MFGNLEFPLGARLIFSPLHLASTASRGDVPLVVVDPWDKLPNIKRLLDEINAQPDVPRAEAVKTRCNIKTDIDDDARKALFPQNERLRT